MNSVLHQTYTNWELLIIDDASTDGTISIIKSFALKHNNIKFFKNEANQGAAVTRNKGIKEASGDFIAFLDADRRSLEAPKARKTAKIYASVQCQC
ncbi:glycosyltransferase family 2 protein [Jejuia pallidilutea]|uniref:glycosyltransferase family 2 protein n=1 Tax=Jejuia pallidilutea TaxID=504487 RepID=UPI00350E36B1